MFFGSLHSIWYYITQYAGNIIKYIIIWFIKYLVNNKSSETTCDKSLAIKNWRDQKLFFDKYQRLSCLTSNKHKDLAIDAFNDYRIFLGLKPIEEKNWRRMKRLGLSDFLKETERFLPIIIDWSMF